jgi:cytochrome d ubiquinol oxidase subunit II
LLPAFYVPIVAMLFALIFRGIAFEFRFRATRFRWLWDWAFSGGAALAAFCQGLVLGGFIDGVKVRDGAFAGSVLDVLTAFGIMCGFGLIAGYALLGAGWLIFKTGGTTEAYGRAAARVALPATLVFIGVVSIWTPLTHPAIAQRWFTWPNIAFLSPVPLATALTALGIWRGIAGPHDARVFILSIVLFLLAFLGLGVSLWPYAVPYAATLWEASSSPATLAFVGIGVAIILPIILCYVAYAYWVFRGKTSPGAGYGH